MDPTISIYFTLLETDVEHMFSSEWEVMPDVMTYIKGIPSQKTWYKNTKEKKACLYITAPEDGYVNALFEGDAPSERWLD